MKKINCFIVTCAAAGALVVLTALVLPTMMPDTALQGPGEVIPLNLENQSSQPETSVREDTPFIDIHNAGGRSILLYPEDPGYPAIEAECREQIRCINAQLKCGFSRAELDAMKHNGTYVAINFSLPTTFETSYIVDGSPREITINEAVFFLDLEDYPENMIITPAQDGAGVWETSRDREVLRDLVAPILQRLQSEDG